MSKKKLKVLGVIFAFVLCFALHFLYDFIPCFITSIIAPVNESIWEHMKILFTSIIISGVIQKIILMKKNIKFNNICFSNFIGALFSIPIFLLIFLPINNLIGENIVVNITLMFIVIVISQLISLFIMNRQDYKFEKLAILFVIMVYVVFGFLTYYPIKSDLFLDKSNHTYGINK